MLVILLSQKNSSNNNNSNNKNKNNRNKENKNKNINNNNKNNDTPSLKSTCRFLSFRLTFFTRLPVKSCLMILCVTQGWG